MKVLRAERFCGRGKWHSALVLTVEDSVRVNPWWQFWRRRRFVVGFRVIGEDDEWYHYATGERCGRPLCRAISVVARKHAR
jgi:hypothetical protein